MSALQSASQKVDAQVGRAKAVETLTISLCGTLVPLNLELSDQFSDTQTLKACTLAIRLSIKVDRSTVLLGSIILHRHI